MSKYTTEVRFICETEAGLNESVGGIRLNEIIDESWEKIFDFDFPIFNEVYRGTLCKKILKHYYFREIGEETYGLWKARLDMRMNEIMPYYNKLYETELLEFNPFEDVDLIREHTLDKTGSETSKTTTDNNTKTDYIDKTENEATNWDMYSDTPQGGLSGVENNTYLTNARKNTIDDTLDKTGSSNTDDSGEMNYHNENVNKDIFAEHIKGKNAGKSYSQLIQEYRNILINIDMMIINDLKDLFLNLW